MSAIIGEILLFSLDVFFWIIIAQIVMSWLIAFDVINVRNPQARNLVALLEKITSPFYIPLRKFIPAIAGIDITPIIIIFGIQILKNLTYNVFF